MSEPKPAPDEGIEALRETAARLEVLRMYRGARERGTVPLVAMDGIRCLAATSVCATLIETGSAPQYWLLRYRVAVDYTRRLTGRPWPLTP